MRLRRLELRLAGHTFPVVVDDDMDTEQVALVNPNGRGVAVHLATGELLPFIGRAAPPPGEP